MINQALFNGGDTSKILLTEAGFELSRGDTDRAIVIYDELSKTHPLVAQVWYDYACVKGVLGDTLTEERYYKESIRLDSTYWRAWHNIGVLYLDRHDLVNAKIALERAIVLNPKNQKVNAALTELYRETNENR